MEEKLTTREMEVLKLICKGFSNREIGECLGISHHTAKAHTEAITRKLKTRNRTTAAFIAGYKNII